MAVSEQTIRADIEAYIEQLESKLADMRRILDGLDGSPVKGRATKRTAKASKGGKRIRRSAEQLKEQAAEIAAAIKAKGSEGASAADLEKFNYGQSLKDYMKKHGHPVTSKGHVNAMRYFVK